MANVYRQFKGDPPAEDDRARAAIRSAIRADAGSYGLVRGPDGVPVRVDVENVLAHVRTYPGRHGRWPLVPLVGPVIAEARKITGSRRGRGRKVMTTRLLVQGDGVRFFSTYVDESNRGRRYWATMYPGSQNDTAKREKRAGGVQLWPPSARPNAGRGNPSPAQRHADASRPGRPSHVSNNSSAGLVALASLVGLAVLARRRAA